MADSNELDPRVFPDWGPLPFDRTQEKPPWRESPFGRVVRFLGERPKPPYPKHERCSVGIGVLEEWDTELEPGVTRLQVFSRVQEKHGLVIVPHCYRGIRPCWCWPDEVEGYKVQNHEQ